MKTYQHPPMPPLCLRLEDLQHRILEVLAWTLAWSKETVQEFTNTSKYYNNNNNNEQSKVQRICNWRVIVWCYVHLGLQGDFQFRVSLISEKQNMQIEILYSILYSSSKKVFDHFIEHGETYWNLSQNCSNHSKIGWSNQQSCWKGITQGNTVWAYAQSALYQ